MATNKTVSLLLFAVFALVFVTRVGQSFRVNTYDDGYGRNTIEEYAITRRQFRGSPYAGGRRFGRAGRPFAPYASGYRTRSGVQVREVVDSGYTYVLKNVPMRRGSDPTKINLDDIPVLRANQVVFLRQPYIIVLPPNSTTTTTAADSDASTTTTTSTR